MPAPDRHTRDGAAPRDTRPIHRSLAVLTLSFCMSAPCLAGAPVDVEVYDRTDGVSLPVHWRDGRRYVAGEPGHEYAVRLRNTSGERVPAVVSVDGVNVVTGQTASPQQSGYVLGPWQSATIDGWRKSLDRVAAFYFTALPDAYATRTGRPGNVGVIGVAVFREKPRPLPPVPAPSYEAPANRAPAAAPPSESAAGANGARREAETAQRAKSADAAAPEPRLGTGHGRALDSRVEWTEFERAGDAPDAVVATWYDSRRNLVARGVLPPPRYAHRDPEPFPASFVPDPR